MIKHYILIASRVFVRHKLYSIINVAGLSVGIACAILIGLFVRDELSFDRWIPQSGNLYRVEVSFNIPGRGLTRLAQVPFPVPHALQDQIPEVQAMTRFVPEQMSVSLASHHYLETVASVDPNFFDVVRIPISSGDPSRALAMPDSALLSESTARKYFGEESPIGKLLTISGPHTATAQLVVVRGVFKDLPYNTQIATDIIIPVTSKATSTSLDEREHSWMSTDGTYGYVRLVPTVSPQAVLEKSVSILDRAIDLKAFGVNARGSAFEKLYLVPFRDAHLLTDQFGGMKVAGSMTTVVGFAAIAVLVLMVAAFNFTNLATARATLRAKEIALRKVSGASRGELVTQFLSEAVVTALIACFIAIVVVELVLPGYGALLGRRMTLDFVSDWQVTIAVTAGAIIVGLLSGLYPALVLSGLTPAAALKANGYSQGGAGRVRVVLVVLQFAVSIGLGIAALVVLSQIRYARNINLGFDRDGVIVLEGLRKLGPDARDSLERILKGDQHIESVTTSNAVPFNFYYTGSDLVKVPGAANTVSAIIVCAAPSFPSVYGIPVVAGRMLSADRGDDIEGRTVLVNAQAARQFGLRIDQAVGKTISLHTGPVAIAGVLGDAKLDGVKETTGSMVFRNCKDRVAFLSARVRSGQTVPALAAVDATWNSVVPDAAVQRSFLSDKFDSLFTTQERQVTTLVAFVSVALLISCLGLFGLATFTAARRTKEIGVRKAFGARTSEIARLLVWQMVVPVMVANLVAWPIAYFYLRHWLDGFAYRVTLGPQYFLGSAVVALLVACATVLANALRMARASPMSALRYE